MVQKKFWNKYYVKKIVDLGYLWIETMKKIMNLNPGCEERERPDENAKTLKSKGCCARNKWT